MKVVGILFCSSFPKWPPDKGLRPGEPTNVKWIGVFASIMARSCQAGFDRARNCQTANEWLQDRPGAIVESSHACYGRTVCRLTIVNNQSGYPIAINSGHVVLVSTIMIVCREILWVATMLRSADLSAVFIIWRGNNRLRH